MTFQLYVSKKNSLNSLASHDNNRPYSKLKNFPYSDDFFVELYREQMFVVTNPKY